ncbi:hypothetical protein [Lachnoclostridium phytofermentans]|uniref:hypothetical protein n=1 Tax=Lachnoclostridium phytofermentans TaxID=66219 RepID=UPI0000D80C4B|nr:hypothetical protein [Lachnoclostridium phytofermentans]
MKILFFARDIRGGLGERKIFRICMNWLSLNYPKTVLKNMDYVSEYGRYDDLLSLFGTSCESSVMDLISKQISDDIKAMQEGQNNISFIAKWLPSSSPKIFDMVKSSELDPMKLMLEIIDSERYQKITA